MSIYADLFPYYLTYVNNLKLCNTIYDVYSQLICMFSIPVFKYIALNFIFILDFTMVITLPLLLLDTS